jgi:hypothetical protein
VAFQDAHEQHAGRGLAVVVVVVVVVVVRGVSGADGGLDLWPFVAEDHLELAFADAVAEDDDLFWVLGAAGGIFGGVSGVPEVEAFADHVAEVCGVFCFAGLAADGGAIEVEFGVDGADDGGAAAACFLAGDSRVGDAGAEDDDLAGEELALDVGGVQGEVDAAETQVDFLDHVQSGVWVALQFADQVLLGPHARLPVWVFYNASGVNANIHICDLLHDRIGCSVPV